MTWISSCIEIILLNATTDLIPYYFFIWFRLKKKKKVLATVSNQTEWLLCFFSLWLVDCIEVEYLILSEGRWTVMNALERVRLWQMVVNMSRGRGADLIWKVIRPAEEPVFDVKRLSPAGRDKEFCTYLSTASSVYKRLLKACTWANTDPNFCRLPDALAAITGPFPG